MPATLTHQLTSSNCDLVASFQELGVAFQYPFAKTGVVGTIGSGSPVVVLRSDMDGLPIEEPEGLSFRSTHPGRMHACGHDGASPP